MAWSRKWSYPVWLSKLDIHARKKGYDHHSPYHEAMGEDYWRDYYEEGDTPKEAFEDDLSWDAVG